MTPAAAQSAPGQRAFRIKTLTENAERRVASLAEPGACRSPCCGRSAGITFGAMQLQPHGRSAGKECVTMCYFTQRCGVENRLQPGLSFLDSRVWERYKTGITGVK